MATSLYDHAVPGLLIETAQATSGPQAGRGLGDAESFAFVNITHRLLDKIRSKPLGKDLIQGISQRSVQYGINVVVSYGVGTLVPGRADLDKAVLEETFEWRRQAGATNVSYNPFISYDAAIVPGVPPPGNMKALLGCETPAFVALAHELIHAWHTQAGDGKVGNCTGGARLEEAYTVGAGRFAGTRISENAIRREHGVALRQFYASPGDCN